MIAWLKRVALILVIWGPIIALALWLMHMTGAL